MCEVLVEAGEGRGGGSLGPVDSGLASAAVHTRATLALSVGGLKAC
jgi:hypothetical protein